MSTPAASATLTPSAAVWHADGDVVLISETTAFQVHLATLIAVSPLFSGMAGLPQPAAGTPQAPEMYEGKPVITLYDPPKEVEVFLQAVYDTAAPADPADRRPLPSSFAARSVILRLASKYQVPLLRDAVLAALASDYAHPVLRPPHPLAATPQNPTQTQTQNDVTATRADLGEVLFLCHMTDVVSLVPLLLYDACVALPAASAVTSVLAALPQDAAQDVLVRLVTGGERLRDAEVKHYLAFLESSRSGCTNLNSDRSRLQLFAPRALFDVGAEGPYRRWCARNPELVGQSLGLCDACCVGIKDEIERGRHRLLEELPSIFGFTSWVDLGQQDTL